MTLGVVFRIRSKKNFKTRPKTAYGGETSRHSLLQGGVKYYAENLRGFQIILTRLKKTTAVLHLKALRRYRLTLLLLPIIIVIYYVHLETL